MPQVVDPKLLEMLVCPLTKETLIFDQAADELISRGAKLAYPIRDGIPILLIDEARSLSEEHKSSGEQTQKNHTSED